MNATDGLGALLSGQVAPGVYRWESAAAPDDVRRMVEAAAWTFGHVATRTGPVRAGFLAGVAAALDLPGYFGGNFDALADCLRDLPGPTLLLWDGPRAVTEEDHAGYAVAVAVLRERARDVTGAPFAALLRGVPLQDAIPPLPV